MKNTQKIYKSLLARRKRIRDNCQSLRMEAIALGDQQTEWAMEAILKQLEALIRHPTETPEQFQERIKGKTL